MSALDVFKLAGGIVLIAILVVLLILLSAAIGGVVGYGVAWAYVNILGFSLSVSLIDSALVGSIVGLLSGSGAAASN